MTPTKENTEQEKEHKIDPKAPAGSPNSLGAQSVRDGRPSTDDSVVEAKDEVTPDTGGKHLNVQVTVTRTDGGATTQVRMDKTEMRKDYASWEDALQDAQQLGLINAVEATAAQVLPPGMPLHASTDIQSTDFTSHGFTSEKLPPPQ